MEPNLKEQIVPSPTPFISGVCSVCHQPILAQYYFCPNCGVKVDGKELPLDTTAVAQVKIYLLSIIQPMVLFIFYTKWHGIKYFKSNDPEAHKIGQVACMILTISTIFTIWFSVLSYNWMIQSIQSSISSSMSADGL